MTGLRRSPSALWRRSGARALVLVPPRDEVLLLDGPAAAVWLLLDGERSVADLVEELAGIFDVPAGVAEEHVASLVHELVATGILLPC